MIVTREGDTITISLNAPWERDAVDWVMEQYGPDYIKNHLNKMLLSKSRAKEYVELREEFVRRQDNGQRGRED